MSLLFPSQTITFDAALRDLARGSARGRAAAAHALGDVGPDDRDRVVPALIAALEDDAAEVRTEAAASLGNLADERAVAPLARRLDDGIPVVRQSAAIALGSLGFASAFESLAQALRDGPADVRFQAATSIAEIDSALAYEPLIAALGDADAQVIGAVALSLGAIGDGRATGHLARLLEHTDRGVRFDAAYALAELGDGRGRDALRAALADDDRAWDAIDSLERLGSADDVDALTAVLGRRGLAPQTLLRAATAVLTLGGPDSAGAGAARRVLLAGLQARKLPVRGLAVQQLAEVGGPWATAPLEALRGHRRGRDLLEEVDAALVRIRERGAP